MLVFKTETEVKGITGKDVTNFLLNCNDLAYQKWWPGVHLELHTVKHYPNNLGDVIFINEYIGKYRLKMHAIINKVVPGKEIEHQFKYLIKLPGKFSIKLDDSNGYLKIKHQVNIGFNGIGKILDPFFRIFFPRAFEKALNKHVKTEFGKLKDVLQKSG